MQALLFNITPGSWVLTKLMSMFLGKKAYWGQNSGVKLLGLEPPTLPGPGWVRCRTRLGGICGTDLTMLTLSQAPSSILQGFSSMPLIPGHENVAEVVEAGEGVDPAWVGKRVCVEPTLGCTARGIDPPCPRCAAGEFGACENFGAAGVGRYSLPAGTSIGYNSRTGGSWGELFVAHESQLVPLPAELSDEQAALTDPLACSLHGVLRADLSHVKTICVCGGGILGLGVISALRAVGFTGQIDILARHNFQKDLALRYGVTNALSADWASDLDSMARHIGGQVVHVRFGGKMLMGGYDAVFDCVGSTESFTSSLKLARARGQIVLVGTAGMGKVDITSLWFRELNVLGAYGRQMEHWDGRRVSTYEVVHELMLSGKMATAGLLTHTFPLADYPNAFATATGKGASHCVRAAFAFR